MAKCPKCAQSITRLDIEKVPTSRLGHQYTAVLLICPNRNCDTVLGAAIDPVAIGEDLVDRVKVLLGGR